MKLVSDLLRPDEASVAKLVKSFGDDDPKVLTTFATSFLEPTDHSDSLGRFARYEIMELLGRGGMGIVMRGFDTSLNRHSAIKVLAPELATCAAARKRFSREAKSAAAVVHPHVVPIQTVDEHNGLPYLVMPVVEGQSLQQRVEQTGPLSVIETVRIAAQVASGLQAAHEQGLVHRDIKPANVLLENGVERVQITDFGLARAIDDASMTRSGVITGTPQYMSPEQAHGDTIDHRSDLFSLGSLIYFMLAARSPFRAETTMGVLNRIGNDEPRSLRSINAEVPQWLEQIVTKLLSKSRDDRFQTASAVGELLQDWHAHLQQPDIVPRPSEPTALAAGPSAAKAMPEASAFGSRGGLTKWLIATAAFAFFAFAGVLIVLEMNKGTLTIQCEADDVPVRIMQGDKVVEQLTVSQAGKSIRIAAGNYAVEVDQAFDKAVVDGGKVSLKRGDTEIVNITLTERGKVFTLNGSLLEESATSNPDSLTAFLQQYNKETVDARTSPHLAGISFTGPEEMVITPVGLGTALSKFGVRLEPRKTHRVALFLRYQPILKDAVLRGWLDVYPSTPKSAKFLKEQSISLAITEEDIRAAWDHVVTKVVYLPDSEADNPTSSSTRTVILAESDLSTRIPDGENSILLVLRIVRTFKSRDLSVDDAGSGTVVTAPSMEFDTLEDFLKPSKEVTEMEVEVPQSRPPVLPGKGLIYWEMQQSRKDKQRGLQTQP